LLLLVLLGALQAYLAAGLFSPLLLLGALQHT
jgi:hypothetical protein